MEIQLHAVRFFTLVCIVLFELNKSIELKKYKKLLNLEPNFSLVPYPGRTFRFMEPSHHSIADRFSAFSGHDNLWSASGTSGNGPRLHDANVR